MGKSGLLVLLLILFAEAPMLPGQGEKTENAGAQPSLTAEQREILRNRAILENLELLENLDKCRLLDLFLEDPENPSGESEKSERNKK